MAPRLLLAIKDLIFLAKVGEAARGLSIELVTGNVRLSTTAVAELQPKGIFLDLNLSEPTALEWIRSLKADPITQQIPIVAFAPHVQSASIAAALAAGCDRVLARSAFSQRLPGLLRELLGKDQ